MAAEARRFAVQFRHQIFHAVIGLGNAGRRKRIGCDDIGAGLRIGEMDRLDRMRLRQHEQIVVAAQVTRPIGETGAAEICLAEFMRLDHRAHRAVEHKNALSGSGAKFVMAIGRGHFGHQATFVSAFGRRPSRWQIA